MGRSNALPKSFFGAIDPKRHIPRNNIIFVGVIALIGSWVLSYGLGAEMLNFGALIAFMGVNMAAFIRYFVRENQKSVLNLVPPLAGFFICLLLWINLSKPAMIAGAAWLVVGLIYGVIKTRGFRGDLVDFELPPEGA
jgi:amino acid transporter